ncbi:MAG TPA: SDR family oxidoreductase [Thermoanaerobaculia bacterium]|nr:SDR family oxidoreductase [Thermoanaerobaculia bacterium]
MKDLFDLDGKVAIVTGSTKGIGKAIAEGLAAHGARVVISSRKEDACERVAAAVREAGGEALAIPCNVSDRAQLENLVAKTREAWGRVDVAVCNAAVNPFYGSSLDIPDSAFQKVMDVNIGSVMALCKLVIPEMRESRDGVIIIVSSVGGRHGSTVLGAYAISKAADMQIARNLALEFGPDNIRVNCIAPGLVKTDFARALWENPELNRARSAATPLRRLGEPEDIAGIAVYLASKAGSWTTGQTFVIDGGVDAG